MDTAGVTAAAQSDRQHQPERLSRLSRRTMAADVGSISTTEADDLMQQPTQPKSLGRVLKQSGYNSEIADTCATADDAVPDEGVEKAGEADTVAPSIPAEIPDHVVLPRLADRSAVIAPADAIGDALAAYNILRAFSWQIRLSPFAFEELCAALFNPNPSPLMDELHICLIRSLAFDENKAERAQRGLDLGCLDSMSWPEYVWEYLYMHEDDLRHHRQVYTIRWTQQQTPAGPGRGTPDKSRGSSPNAETTFKSGLSDPGAKTSITITGRSPSKLSRAGANGHSGAASGSPEAARSLNGLVTAVEDDQEIQNIRALMRRPPFRHKTQLEYYALPAGVKAAILVSLVNDLLDISSVRHEIDKREAAGQWVAGKGGAGGSFPMRSEEERARRADADSDAEANDDDSEEEAPAAAPELFEDDGNTDLCVLCGLGGSLLCCDGCPAAYHMRCIGETAKSIPEGEWLCPECSVGGRGETAGLRVPRAGLNQHKQPHWMCHGCLFRSARPEPQDIGGQAQEKGPVPMDKWIGEVAAAEAKALRKIRGEEKPHPTSIHSLRDPPVVKVLASLSAEGYVNRYRNSWTAAVAATKTFVDDMARKKGRPPAGGVRVSIPMADLPVPVPLSRFQWPSSAGKGQRGNLVRCGQCHMCRNPLMKKPCLHPIVPRGLDGLDEGTSAPK
ncbi:MAG: enhancer of isoform C [Trebouxia sp. A1-2]|nr:MAG: enhancer of isoform C [Trebouxia sp. A1-2]